MEHKEEILAKLREAYREIEEELNSMTEDCECPPCAERVTDHSWRVQALLGEIAALLGAKIEEG